MIFSTKRRRRWPSILLISFILPIITSQAFNNDQKIENDSEIRAQPLPKIRSPIDCDFDLNNDNNDMCNWQTDTPTKKSSIWHTGNSVLVDSANSIVKSAMGDDRFAFVQGHFGSASEASLESQILRNAPGITNQLQFSYWKTAFGPILDVCLKKIVDSTLQCIDSISGAGAQQWTQRTLALPRLNEPFRIIFRARNIHSAEDLIGLDEIRLRMADENEEELSDSSSPLLTSTSTLKAHKSGDQLTSNNIDGKKQAIQFSNFEMRRSQSKIGAVIQPAVQRSQPPIALDEQRLPIQDDDESGESNPLLPPIASVLKPATVSSKSYVGGLARSSTQRPIIQTSTTPPSPPNILFHHHSPIPNPKKFEANFPDFPSFDDGTRLNSQPSLSSNPRMEEIDSCKAIKCSFLDTSCLWILGKNWKLGQGNIAIEASGEDIIRSGYFKAPLATFLEFDLWMSDDANLFVLEEVQEVGMPGTDELSLFSRRGMSNNGWHRFRVPLRPSFNSIRLKIRAVLPNQNAFVTLSNTRLVNGNGEEAICETTPGVLVAPMGGQWSSGVPLMNGVLQSGGLTTMSDLDSITTMTPFLGSISPLATGTPPLSGNPFALPMVTNSPMELMKNLDAEVKAFQQQSQQPTSPTMMIDGVTPIVPMQESIGQRLTAFQKMQQPFTFPTLAPFPSLFDQPSPQSQMFPFLNNQPAISRPSSTTEAPPPDPFNDNDMIAVATTRDSISLKELSENDAFTEATDTFARDNQLSSSSLAPNRGQFNGQDIGRFLGGIANQPNAEQKLRQLAGQFGLDFDKLASGNGKQLAALRQVFSGQRPIDLPSSVGQTHGESNGEMKPIRPENVNEQDFERVIQQEAQKRLSGQTVNGDMLKKLAKLLNLTPQTQQDDSPMARDNLDFIFQNAMNG